MDIAFLGYENGVDPAIIGGTQSYLRRLAEQLADKGHNVDVFVYGAAETSRSNLKPFRQVFYIRSLTEAGRILQEIGSYDTMIVTNFPPRWFFNQFIQLHKWRKICRSICYLFVVRSSNGMMRMVKNIVARLFYDYVIAASGRLQIENEKFGSKTYLMLPPIPPIFFSERGAGGEQKIKVAYIGRISEDKGVDGLIPALEEIGKNIAELDVRIYGYHNANDESARRLHERALSSEYISYAPEPRAASEQSDAYMAKLLHETDILVFPYRELSGETVDVPLLLLEAIASGCVVISTPVGDIPRIINDDRLILTEENDLMKIIKYLINDVNLVEKRQELTENMKKMPVSQPEAGERLIEILQENVGRSRNLQHAG